MSDAEATDIVAEAIDGGVNGFDVAPSYFDAELRLGAALRGRRDSIFLQCKTTERSARGAAKELRESLRHLRTDHFDLYQLHALNLPEELDQVLAPGGAMEAIIKARDAGLTRFVGITTHCPSTLTEALRRFPFDTVMAPVNLAMERRRAFAQELLEEARRRGVGMLAIKGMAARPWRKNEKRKYPLCWYRPIEDDDDARLALRFTLSQPVATAVSPGAPSMLRRAIASVQGFRRLDSSDEPALAALAKRLKPVFA